MVYSKWINRKRGPITQKRNNKDVAVRETIPAFDNCTGEKLLRQEIIGFHDVTVQFLDAMHAICGLQLWSLEIDFNYAET